MRVLGALLITVFILGGLRVFFALRHQVRPAPAVAVIQTVDDPYTLEATLTFDAAPDEFDLQPAALVVECQGETLYTHEEPIPAWTRLSIPLEHSFVVGANELFVRVTPRAGSDDESRALRIRIARGSHDWLVDQTVWAEAGEPIEAAVPWRIPSADEDVAADEGGP